MDEMKPIHDNCRMIRDVWRFEIKEIASLFGLTYTIWGNYERGKTDPSPDVLLEMEKLTGVTIRRLLTEELTRSDLPKEPLKGEQMKQPIEAIPRYNLPLQGDNDSKKEVMKDSENLPIIERLKRLEQAVFGG